MPTPTYGRSLQLAQMKPHELLLLFGGILSVALGGVLFALAYSTRWTSAQLSSATLTLVVDAALGVAFWVAFIVARKNAMNGGIIALVSAFVLIAFGGQAGLIAGIFGLLAGVLALAHPWLSSQAKS